MGVVNANVVISNPADRRRSWEEPFVDTVATDSLVPRRHPEAIALKPEAQRTYDTLALSDDGWNWIDRNEALFALRKDANDTPSIDDDIPFEDHRRPE